jgi:hypothetical protein
VQYLAIRYTQRLANGTVSSVGSRGDSFNNALPKASTGYLRPN